jgi:hypothetical protein
MADKYFHQRLIPAAATETTIYTVPAANTAIIKSLRVTNASGISSDITVSQYDADGGTAVFLLKESALAADATVEVFIGVPLVLEESNVLKVTATQSDVSFYLSYLEVDRD